MDHNYYATLIAVADDCPVTAGVVPPGRGDKPTAAVLQYQMLADRPYTYTQGDVLFESWLRRQDGADEASEDELRALREAFFAKPQPCLRASPLPKKYGWGLLFDEHGRVALCPVESAEYAAVVAGKRAGIAVLKAMRSSRR